jgi:hypothetical protein
VSVSIAFNALLALTCGYALIRGSAPERIAVAIIGVGTILTIVMMPAAGHRYRHVEADILWIDVGMYLAFQQLALHADRFWTLRVAGLQLAILLIHMTIAVIPEFVPPAYTTAQWLFAALILVILAIGTWRHQRRLALYGVDRDWSSAHAERPH